MKNILNQKRERFVKFAQTIYPGIIWADIWTNHEGETCLMPVDAVGNAFWDIDGGDGRSSEIPDVWEGIKVQGVGNLGDGLGRFVHFLEGKLQNSVRWYCDAWREEFYWDLDFNAFIKDPDIKGLDGCYRITMNKDKVTCPACNGRLNDESDMGDGDG